MSFEAPRTPEFVQTQPNLLIVLGKNIGVDSTVADIQANTHTHLSIDGRLNVIAAGMLYESQPGTQILFSSGKTAGEDVPAESEAQRSYLKRLFPGIPDGDIAIEDRSIDTAGNAEEVAKILQGTSYARKDLLTVGYHGANAAKLFTMYGVEIDTIVASEEVVSNRSEHHAAYIAAWDGLKRVKQERAKETFRKVMLHTIDPKGKLLRKLTERSRQ